MATQNTKYYPETVRVRVPEGWQARLEAAARWAETTPAEWHRNLIRDALRDAERKHEEEQMASRYAKA